MLCIITGSGCIGIDVMFGYRSRKPGNGCRMVPRSSQLCRWLRGLWPDRNPLRRASDRAEAAVVACLAAALLIGVPLTALFAARWSYDADHHTQRVQAAWWQVPAVLLTDASEAPGGPGPLTQHRVLAKWTAPNRTRWTGRIPASQDSRAGTVVRIWVDASGRPTGMPLQDGDAEREATLTAAFAAAGLGLILLGAALLARRMLTAAD